MKKSKGYTSSPLSFTRKMVIASANRNKKNAIHCISEIDISKARQAIKKRFIKTGEKISCTGYVVKCFGEAIKEFPEMNSFIKGRRIIQLEDITISVLVEREVAGQKVPEPLAIHNVGNKNVLLITEEIRNAQSNKGNELGDLTNSTWIRLIPGFMLKLFIRIADRNIKMAKKYGKISVTAVGMFTDSPAWFIPHGTATILLTVGSIYKKREQNGKKNVLKEYLSITASFDHEIIDGAPAARFISRFSKILSGAEFLKRREIYKETY